MPTFERIWVAALSKGDDDAGSDGALNLTINVGGEDVLDADYDDEPSGGEATIFQPRLLDPSVDLSGVTHSSVRVGLRSDDAWGPRHILVVGEALPDVVPGRTMALNWYEAPALVPFTRADIVAAGGITLRILGDDAWRPLQFFLFGLDTPTGRPNAVVTLVSEPVWPHGWMSSDTSEGVASVDLDVVSV